METSQPFGTHLGPSKGLGRKGGGGGSRGKVCGPCVTHKETMARKSPMGKASVAPGVRG